MKLVLPIISSLRSDDIQSNMCYLVHACIGAEILFLWNNIKQKGYKISNI